MAKSIPTNERCSAACLSGYNAIAGLSGHRKDKTISGLQLNAELVKRDADAWCGLQVIKLSSGNVIEWVRLNGMVTELYDVATLKNVIRPMVLGFKTIEIVQLVSMDRGEMTQSTKVY